VTSRGGFCIHNLQEDASLKLSCFVLSGSNEFDDSIGLEPFAQHRLARLDQKRISDFPILQEAFFDNIVSFGPNDFFVMQKAIKEESNNPSLTTVVSLLKLSDWDADVFYKYRDLVINKISNGNSKIKHDLHWGMPKIWENFFMLNREKDIAFEIGRFYYGIQMPSEGLHFYEISSGVFGEHHVTFYNIGLCHYALNNKIKAADSFRRSIVLNNSYLKASSWLEKVLNELEPHDLKEKENFALTKKLQACNPLETDLCNISFSFKI